MGHVVDTIMLSVTDQGVFSCANKFLACNWESGTERPLGRFSCILPTSGRRSPGSIERYPTSFDICLQPKATARRVFSRGNTEKR